VSTRQDFVGSFIQPNLVTHATSQGLSHWQLKLPDAEAAEEGCADLAIDAIQCHFQPEFERRIGALLALSLVRFGSLAEVVTGRFDVRFAPDSGHHTQAMPCPFCARSGSRRPTYSITSSTCVRSSGETAIPSELATLRFITIWNFVGACTGSSAGLSPLRTRST
jgi:hypothetical protein